MRRHPYEIRVEGTLSNCWTDWFDGLHINHEDGESDGQAVSILTGSMDQAALHGILMKIRDLGLSLLAVSRVNETSSIQARRSR
jgi:hypothetical protein